MVRDLVLFNLVPKTESVDVMPVGMLIDENGSRTRLQPSDMGNEANALLADMACKLGA